MYAIYMVLSYLSLAGFGESLLKTGILPSWVGWTGVIFGVGACVLFLARVRMFNPPLMIYVFPFIIGVMLLRR